MYKTRACTQEFSELPAHRRRICVSRDITKWYNPKISSCFLCFLFINGEMGCVGGGINHQVLFTSLEKSFSKKRALETWQPSIFVFLFNPAMKLEKLKSSIFFCLLLDLLYINIFGWKSAINILVHFLHPTFPSNRLPIFFHPTTCQDYETNARAWCVQSFCS